MYCAKDDGYFDSPKQRCLLLSKWISSTYFATLKAATADGI